MAKKQALKPKCNMINDTIEEACHRKVRGSHVRIAGWQESDNVENDALELCKVMGIDASQHTTVWRVGTWQEYGRAMIMYFGTLEAPKEFLSKRTGKKT